MTTTLEGLPIRNAKRPLLLHVTQGDIRRQARKSPSKCALAEACSREHGGAEVRIYLSRAYLLRNKHWVRYTVSPAAQREIVSFDRGAGFSPGTYVLRAISDKRARGGDTKTKTGLGQRRQGLRVRTTNVRVEAPISRKVR